MKLEELDSTKLTYENIIDGLPIKAPKWAREIYQYGGEPVCAIDFYQDIFKDGYLEPHRAPEDYQTGEYGGIVIKARKTTAEERKRTGRTSIAERFTFTDGCDELLDVIKNAGTDFVFLSPASYAGKNRTNANARYLYAIAFEIDNILEAKGSKPDGIKQLFYSFERVTRPIPRPTYIVCSGTGLHLYYVLKRPVPLFKNVLESINAWRKFIIKWSWDGVSELTKNDIQYEHALQGFRAVGARTKGNTFAMAFKTGTEWSIEELNEYAERPQYKISLIYQSKLRLDDAKELYPDWYERRIIKGQEQGSYKRSEGIYQNWISKIYTGAKVGHRYYCLLTLVALATQCGIPFEQLEEDAYHLTQYLDTKTTDEEKNPFTAYDMECALNFYGSEDAYLRKVEYIEEATGISCTRAKRNGRSQQQHVKLMNFARELDNENWREGNGPKPKWAIVNEWRKKHPTGNKAACIRETGLSKNTVKKWWDETENPDTTGVAAENMVKSWQRANPSGSKRTCHVETGVSMYYINKAWKTGFELHKGKYLECLTPLEKAQYIQKNGRQLPIKNSKKLLQNHRTSLDRLLDDNELLK